jgi:type I restriction enzyme S subunit
MKDVRDGTHDSPKYYNEGHPLVTSKNLTDHGLDMSDVSLISDEDFEAINQRSKVDVGDIIFGMIGTIGNSVILERDDFAIKNVAMLKNGGEVDNTFLNLLLKSPVFDRYMLKKMQEVLKSSWD